MKTVKSLFMFAMCTLLFGSTLLSAQTTNTAYFMEDITERYKINPALMPNSKFYFDFILLPNFYINAGNNDLILRDLIYNNGSLTQGLLKDNASKDKFFNSLRPTTMMNFDFGINILSFGVRIKEKHYVSVDMGLNATVNGYIPRDIFSLALYGTPDKTSNSFDMSTLGVDAMLYSSVGVGYMYRINERWTVGAKAKFLMGYASVYTDIDNIQLDASMENWTLKSKGQINASLPINYQMDNGSIAEGSLALQKTDDIIKLLYDPAGYGVSFDIGATFSPIKNLSISASVTDLGFINWGRNIITGRLKGEHSFEGVDYVYGDDIAIGNQVSGQLGGLVDEVVGSVTITEPSSYNQMLHANFIFAAEYGILKNKISFGALSRTRFNKNFLGQELTLAANFRPCDWFKTSLSYSFIDGRWGTIGLGLNLNLGPLSTFIIADYIPLSWANVHNDAGVNLPLPYRTQRVNLQAGFSWNIYRDARDRDRDGVYGFRDRCPDTDTDYLRKACNTNDTKTLVTRRGCLIDADGDGIGDCLDRCSDTPSGVAVDSLGCPLDADKDGVADYLDKCSNTPVEADVDDNGCPKDDDNDGTPNYMDQCPNTPSGVSVTSNGCPVDADADGVADYLDRCPNTPIEAAVDAQGCPIDTDGDGVADYLDKCPETGLNVAVDAQGCPLDADGDGVLNADDKCPYKPGPASNFGCPELKREVTNVFKKALHGIQFQSGRAAIKSSSNSVLSQIVAIMELNTDYNLIIKGHTDSQGNDNTNLKLSLDRAQAVVDYLVKQGVAPERLKAEGYGETMPIADNKTSKGRAKNRRVEIEVTYTETTMETIVNPELKDTTTTTTNDTIK